MTSQGATSLSRLWLGVAVVVLAVLVLVEGVPESPQGGFGRRNLEVPILLALGGVVVLAAVAAWWVPRVAAAVAAPAGFLLGGLAGVEHAPLTGVVVAAVVVAAAAATWWAARPGPVWRGAGVLVGLALVAVTLPGTRTTHRYLGPTQPESDTVLAPVDLVRWAWAGGTTADGVTVTAEVAGDGDAVLVVDDDDGVDDAVRSAPQPARAGEVVRLRVEGLVPDTAYTYAVEVGGRLDRGRPGRFRTFPDGPASFAVAVGACAWTGSNGRVFDTIREREPLLFLHTGDLHYEDITVDDPERFHEAYDDVLTSPSQSSLYRSTSVAYVWDDHDFGGNDADGRVPSRRAAHAAYREVVPHYPLPGGDEGTIHQAFTIGRVRVVVLDTRSGREPGGRDGGGTMLGAEQLAWLRSELEAASGRFPLVLLVNPDPWIAPAEPGRDDWGGYAEERAEVAEAIAAADTQVVMLSGDAHMVALDDGTNSNYSRVSGQGFPVLHAAALDRRGTRKGGPYSDGTHPGGGRFGWVEVHDDGGDELRVALTGLTWRGEQLVHHELTVPVPAGAS